MIRCKRNWSAAKSTYIAPLLISKLSAVASGLYAETSSLALYKSNNKEDDTATVIEHAKEKLDSAVKEFNVLKKLLKAEELTTMQHENVPGSVPDVDCVCRHQWRFNPALGHGIGCLTTLLP